ncbi:hypothetical protein [Salinibaculum rarum]|uniref:hypothetical protein n=1 Tax=Salinibaculum rarum TaxID=3058903 RepID=UPI0026602625|nr:hypothetical protein [Salinibaculum sp. KK48]
MTVREIGISTDESEKKADEAFQGNELEKPFPLLKPGRALIDLETSSLIEFFHAPEGGTRPMAGFNQYDPEMGFGEGHVIAQKWVGYRAVDCPRPNPNGEIPVLNNRPEQHELTYKSPDAFREDVIQREGRRPLVLVERPAVAYEEAVLGETFEVLGWYRPWADKESGERLAPVAEMTDEFEGLGGDSDLKQVKRDEQFLSFDGLNAEANWEDVDDPDAVNVMFTVSGTEIEAHVVSAETEQDIHLFDSTVHQKYNKRDIKVHSPYEAKDLIKQGRDSDAEYDDLGWERAHPTWNAEHEVWEIDGDVETVQYAIAHFAAHGFPVTLSGAEAERIATDVYTYIEDDTLGETGLEADESLSAFETVGGVDSDLDLETMTYEGVTPRASIQTVNADGDLLAFDNTLNEDNNGRIIGLGEVTVPPRVKEQWQVATKVSDDSLHEWYAPRTGARIKVKPITNDDVEHTVWGGPVEVERDGETVRGEYGIVVDDSSAEEELVACLADEEATLNTVITHMQALA